VTGERILVVDDEPAMLRTVERVLGPHYDVRTALTAGEALGTARSAGPQLAVLDVRMPDMDGFELANRLRDVCDDLRVIFMTGVIHELDAQLIRSIREKAFYFIQMPFDREVLLTLVDRCLELRRLALANREHVRRLEGELAAARTFQREMLPGERARFAGLTVTCRSRPSVELSGDFFDYAGAASGRVSVLLADVSGHGVSAAMLVGVVKSAYHDAAADDFEPIAVVRRIARGIRSFDEMRFVTVFCGRFDRVRGVLEYVNAGHPPGVLWGPERERSSLVITGPMISPAFPSVSWDQRTLEVGPGDRLLLYTDGLTEARGEEGLFGPARLLALVDGATAPDAELLDSILDAVDRFGGGRPADDDRSLLAVTLES